MNIKEKAHKYLMGKGCLSVSQKFTALRVEEMLVEFCNLQNKDIKNNINNDAEHALIHLNYLTKMMGESITVNSAISNINNILITCKETQTN